MLRCEWRIEQNRCRQEAEPGQSRCIFHLPLGSPGKPADKFWRHFANYYIAQLAHDDVARNAATGLWVFEAQDRALVNEYSDRCLHGSGFDYRGFVFPSMDDRHNLHGFVFAASDFTLAQFAPGSTPVDPLGTGFSPGQPRRHGGEPDLSEPPPAEPEDQDTEGQSAAADFSGAHFMGDAVFRRARFPGTASYSGANFARAARFVMALFEEDVDFSGVHFDGEGDLRVERFAAASKFSNAVFKEHAYLSGAQFDGPASFAETMFLSEAEFGQAHFNSDTVFTNAHFEGMTDFSKVTVAMQLRFFKCTLHDCLLLESPNIAGNGALLLWGLRFAHGGSRVDGERDRTGGSLVESSGEILLRDVARGMDRVSLLRTDIYSDRIHVRFSNVAWNKGRKSGEFLLDAKFLSPIAEWTSMGLGARDAELAELFNRNAGSVELETAVQEDTERIVRDIRRSYEEYAGYSDAGDYHVIEMDFRRRRRKTSRFYKVGLWLYRLFSDYGESPSRALKWLLGSWFGAAVLYMYSGFCFPTKPVRYLFVPDCSNWSAFLTDFLLRSVPFAFVNLFASYFRNMAQPSTQTLVTHGWTVGISIVETTMGIISLTLFLLAVRRRFRR
jgi:hypothetical protein